MDPFSIQQQIRSNTLEVNDFLGDLEKWESDITQKDEKLMQGELKLTREQAKPRQKPARAKNSNTKTTKFTSGSKPASTNGLPIEKRQVPTPTTDLPADDEFTSWKNSGNELFKKGQFTQAVECYSRCLALDDKSTVALSNRAMAYIKSSNFEEALKDLDQLLSLDAQHTKGLYRRALALKGVGRLDEAIASLNTLLEIDSSNKAAKQSLASYQAQVSKRERIEKLRRERESRENAQRREHRGAVHSKRSAFKRVYIEDSDDTKPNPTTPHTLLGALQSQTKPVKEASGLSLNGEPKSTRPLIVPVDGDDEVEEAAPSPTRVDASPKQSKAEPVPEAEAEAEPEAEAEAEAEPEPEPESSYTAVKEQRNTRPTPSPVSASKPPATEAITPPQTAFEFEAASRNYQAQSWDRYVEFLGVVQPGRVPQLLKTSLDAEVCSLLFKGLTDLQKRGADQHVANFLLSLAKTARFDMVLMFLEDEDVAAVRQLCEKLAQSGIEAATIHDLQKAYELE